MLQMAQVNCIRTLRQAKHKSISEIAKVMGVDWRTAKKYADGDVLVDGELPRQRRRRPVLGEFTHLIDAWLEEDTRMPAKQRRTARKIFDELLKQGYLGSARTVRAYVREAKKRLQTREAERFARLEHLPGEAQVDFGEVKVIVAGAVRTYYLLVVSFPYSNAHAARLLPAQNTECFLSALVSIFVEIGGVPPVMVFDNLSLAVRKVFWGTERKLTERFERFRWYYRFEARFCNPGRGHEKGSVENKVGYIRRNFLTPPPVIDDLDEAFEADRKA